MLENADLHMLNQALIFTNLKPEDRRDVENYYMGIIDKMYKDKKVDVVQVVLD